MAKVFKPIYPVGKVTPSLRKSGDEFIERGVLEYVYGSNVAEWLKILPLSSIVHRTTGTSILAMFTDDLTDFFLLLGDTGTEVSTIVFDFDRILELRQIVLVFSMENIISSGTASQTLALEITEDGVTWRTLNTQTKTGALAETFYEYLPIINRVRAIRLTYTTVSGVAVTEKLRLYRLKVLV
jgi:hypothetical protein